MVLADPLGVGPDRYTVSWSPITLIVGPPDRAGRLLVPFSIARSRPAFLREYRALYAMTAERAGRLPAHAVVMHPGPINRGLELDGEVADGPRSIVLEQVSAGVAVRLAVLEAAVAP